MKTCSRCKQSLPLAEFRISNKKKGRYRSECKACGLEYRRAYYQKNKDRVKATSKRIGRQKRAEHKTFLDEYKAFLGCFVCGEERPWRLAFHHLSGKSRPVGYLAGGSLDRILDEMRHCVVLCANCHADVHIGPYHGGMVARTRRHRSEVTTIGRRA